MQIDIDYVKMVEIQQLAEDQVLQQQGAQMLQDEFGAIPDQNWEMQEVEQPNDQAVPPRIERQNVQAQNNHGISGCRGTSGCSRSKKKTAGGTTPR